MGAYHFRLSLFVFDEVAENADLDIKANCLFFT